MSKHSSGKIFESEIRATLKHYEANHENLAWARLPDLYDFVKATNFVSITNPADFMVCFDGTLFMLECKSSLAPRYRKEWVKQHQIDDLRRFEKAGALCFFLFSYRFSLANKRHPDEDTPFAENKLFAVGPITTNQLMKSKEASWTWGILQKYAIAECPRVGGLWDLSPIGLPKIG